MAKRVRVQEPAKKPTKDDNNGIPTMIEGKPVSNYRQVRLAIEKGGPDLGMKHGLHLGLPESQVRAYVKELVGIIAAQAAKKGSGPQTAPAAKARPVAAYEPDWRFADRDAATRHMLAVVRRNHMTEMCFHILEEGGRFALVPISFKPEGPPPQFEEGDIVMDTTIADSRAEIIGAGPWQSMVKYYDSRGARPAGAEQCIQNYYLHKIGSRKDAAFKNLSLPKKAKAGKSKAKPNVKRK